MPTHTSNRVPLFVELRRVRDDLSVHGLLLETLQKYKLPHTEAAWDFLANSGKFVVLMDAFDEIDPALAGRAVADIEKLCEMYGETLQIIVTSRPDADIQRSPRFRVCKLAPLRSEDHLPFLNKICSEKDQAESLNKVLKSSSTEIRGLLTTPLMMTLLVILYKSLQTVPDTVPKFYEELFDVLFYRHDHSKPGFRRKRFTQLDDTKIKKLFSAFCFYVRLEGLGVLSSEQLHICVDRANKACNESIDPDKFKDELIKTVCLMQQDGFEYAFIHKSVTQYYAASFVRSSSEDFAEKFYSLSAKPGQVWELELRFLSQIDTYKYTKYYEIPLLKNIADKLGYSFDTYSPTAESRLTNHLMNEMSLMIRDEDVKNSSGASSRGQRICGWSHVVSDDLLPRELGRHWTSQIVSAAVSDRSFNLLLMERAVALGYGTDDENGDTIQCRLLRDEILAHLPELAKETFRHFQQRHDAAMLVLWTEEQKTAMLSALL